MLKHRHLQNFSKNILEFRIKGKFGFHFEETSNVNFDFSSVLTTNKAVHRHNCFSIRNQNTSTSHLKNENLQKMKIEESQLCQLNRDLIYSAVGVGKSTLMLISS